MFPELTRDDVFRIETAHLWLRWPRAVDARDFARLASDQEAMKQTSCLLAPFDAFTADDFVIGARRANAQSEGMVLALAPRQDPSAFLGMAGVQAKGDGATLVLGYWLGRPYRGQGLMREAIEALVDMALVLTDAKEIETPSSEKMPEAAIHMLASFGFPPSGTDGLTRITRNGWLRARSQAASRIAWPLVAA